jgi:hypothetical protein
MPVWVFVIAMSLVGLATVLVAGRMLFSGVAHFMECLRLTTQSGLVTWYRRETGDAGHAIKRMGLLFFWVIHNLVIAAIILAVVSFSMKESAPSPLNAAAPAESSSGTSMR